ncbi:MAG: hypothetical protein AAGB15_11235 [Pseudomonadota bacterium]
MDDHRLSASAGNPVAEFISMFSENGRWTLPSIESLLDRIEMQTFEDWP